MAATKSKSYRHTAPRTASRVRRHLRVRKKLTGSSLRPRLSVSRSSRHIFAQLIDDGPGHTLASASTLEDGVRSGGGDKKAKAHQVGKLLAERALAAGISSAVFDRGGYAYTAGSPRLRTAPGRAGWPYDSACSLACRGAAHEFM